VRGPTGSHVTAGGDGSAAVTIRVAGGAFADPYYTFADADGAALDLASFSFVRGTEYTFEDAGVSAAHPFDVGAARGQALASASGTGPLDGTVGGSLTFTLPADYAGELVYYCTDHPSMTSAALAVVDGGRRGRGRRENAEAATQAAAVAVGLFEGAAYGKPFVYEWARTPSLVAMTPTATSAARTTAVTLELASGLGYVATTDPAVCTPRMDFVSPSGAERPCSELTRTAEGRSLRVHAGAVGARAAGRAAADVPSAHAVRRRRQRGGGPPRARVRGV
jgi:plastocyanin